MVLFKASIYDGELLEEFKFLYLSMNMLMHINISSQNERSFDTRYFYLHGREISTEAW